MTSLLESVFRFFSLRQRKTLRPFWCPKLVTSLMEHIFSAKSLKRGQGNCPVCPPSGCGSGYPSIISKCFPRISVVFPYIFSCLVLYCLEIKTLLERILLATSQDTVVCSKLELNFLFFSGTSSVFPWHFSLDTHLL